MKPTAKAGARHNAPRQHAPAWEEPSAPHEPHFYGAASRKRAMELLGQSNSFSMPSRKGRQYEAPPPPPPQKQKWEAAPKAKEPAPEPEFPPLLHIDVAPEAALITQGYPTNAPMVSFSKALHETGLSSTAAIMLQELGVDSTEIELKHDSDWQDYPEVGDAIKAAGGEENAFCIATCPGRNLYGVGLGGKQKFRENVAKLALCVAVAGQADDAFAAKFPGFMEFQSSGALPAPVVAEWEPASKKRRQNQNAESAEEAAPVDFGATEEGEFPRDVPLWVTLPIGEPRPDKLISIAGDEALTITTQGKRRKGLYNQAEACINALMPDGAADIEYHDDANWEDFPAVGIALKAIADKEECMTIATSASRDIWAVGVGMRGNSRFTAAKAAMAVALALQAMDNGDGSIPEEIAEMTAMCEFIEEAKESRIGR